MPSQPTASEAEVEASKVKPSCDSAPGNDVLSHKVTDGVQSCSTMPPTMTHDSKLSLGVINPTYEVASEIDVPSHNFTDDTQMVSTTK